MEGNYDVIINLQNPKWCNYYGPKSIIRYGNNNLLRLNINGARCGLCHLYAQHTHTHRKKEVFYIPWPSYNFWCSAESRPCRDSSPALTLVLERRRGKPALDEPASLGAEDLQAAPSKSHDPTFCREPREPAARREREASRPVPSWSGLCNLCAASAGCPCVPL